VKQIAGNGTFTPIYWDLRHHIPRSDAEFYRAFANELVSQLAPRSEELATFFGGNGDLHFESIRTAFEYQHAAGEKTLLILDGLDDTLQVGNLSKNVWDNLRSLADLSSLRFITGSRLPLRALCTSPESQTSDFWNIFHPEAVRLGALSDDDLEKFTMPLPAAGITLSKPARGQLERWTGNSPLLAAAMCKSAIESGFQGEASPRTVDEWAAKTEDLYRDFIRDLWDDCPALLQGDIIEICSNPPYDRSKVSAESIKELQLRGYISGNREGLRCSNGFIENCAKRHGNILPDIKRLFGSRQSFEKNVKALLELRLQDIKGADKELSDHIWRAVQEVAQPHVSIGQIRSVSNRALELIWDVEAKDRVIPKKWTEAWKFNGVQAPPVGNLPADEGGQLQVLNLLTDKRKSVRARAATRSIYCLMGFLHSVGNLGQHPDAAPSIGLAAAACFAAIQLAEELTRICASDRNR
jgi:hypothetical protein